jgi:hypothetical protein
MSLAIIDDLNLVGVFIPPGETKTPLVVDPYAVIFLSFPVQSFQAITRRCCQIPQFGGAVQLPELSAGNLLDGLKAPATLAVVKPRCLSAPERPDHESYCIPRSV